MNLPSHARRFRVLAIGSIVAAMTLTACGGSDSDSDGSGGGSDLPDEIVIGATLPLTGPGAAYGKLMLDGIEMAIGDINENGGLDGSTYKVRALDSQGQAGLAVTATRQLLAEDDPVGIITAYGPPPLAQTPIAAREEVPVFNGGGNDPAQLDTDFLWLSILTSLQEASGMMQWSVDNLDVSKLGLLLETNASPENLQAIQDTAKAITGQDPVVETVDQTATDVGPQLDKLLAADVDAIYTYADGNIQSLILKQASQRDIKIPLLGYSASLGVPEALASPNLNLYASSQKSTPTPEFQTVYDAYPGYKEQQPPNLYLMNYYTLAQIIHQSLSKAVDEDMPATGATIEKILQAHDTTFEGAAGEFTFTENHGANGDLDINQVVDGGIKVIDTVPAPSQ